MQPQKGSLEDWQGAARPQDLNKAHSTIRQLWRDWSEDGFAAEVRPILNVVVSDLLRFCDRPAQETKLLLPGAGLGRLLFELCMRGYNVEGNEISYHQLLASNFILNATQQADQFKLFPSVTSFTNHVSRSSQLKSVTIPDVHTGTAMNERRQLAEREHSEGIVPPGDMEMTAGDFITSYGSADSHESFDAVISAYFIDTAPNVIRYIETVHNCLKVGGLWINIGPLLWHFEDRVTGGNSGADDASDDQQESDGHDDTGIGEPGAFELTNEEVLQLLSKMGFTILKQEMQDEGQGGYIQDPNSMLQSRYRCSHWVARRQ